MLQINSIASPTTAQYRFYVGKFLYILQPQCTTKACGSKSYDHTYTDDTYRRTVGTLTVDLQYVRARFRICFVVDLCSDVQICQLNLSLLTFSGGMNIGLETCLSNLISCSERRRIWKLFAMVFSNRVFALLCILAAVDIIVNAFNLCNVKAVGRFSTVLQLVPHACPTDSPESLQDMVTRALEGLEKKKRISLLGSTGSIGTQTLDICRERPGQFECVAMAAGTNLDLLAKQIAEFKPKLVSIQHSNQIDALRVKLRSLGIADNAMPMLAHGDDGIVAVATHGDCDIVVTGIVGCAGLLPTVAAIKAGKDIALANKETLIAGGPVVVPLLRKHNVKMLPADSEHSAIFQCLQGFPPGALRRVILTASGGAFRDWPIERLAEVKVADALKHPNWAMGAKITVDSATMMNKGLEVIEAHYLFGAAYDDIDIVVHPQSIVHSAVEAQDTSVIAQLGWPDMRLPLLYAISWPARVPMPWKALDLASIGYIKIRDYCADCFSDTSVLIILLARVYQSIIDILKCFINQTYNLTGTLTFKAPDHAKYPCIPLAYAAGKLIMLSCVVLCCVVALRSFQSSP